MKKKTVNVKEKKRKYQRKTGNVMTQKQSVVVNINKRKYVRRANSAPPQSRQNPPPTIIYNTIPSFQPVQQPVAFQPIQPPPPMPIQPALPIQQAVPPPIPPPPIQRPIIPPLNIPAYRDNNLVENFNQVEEVRQMNENIYASKYNDGNLIDNSIKDFERYNNNDPYASSGYDNEDDNFNDVFFPPRIVDRTTRIKKEPLNPIDFYKGSGFTLTSGNNKVIDLTKEDDEEQIGSSPPSSLRGDAVSVGPVIGNSSVEKGDYFMENDGKIRSQKYGVIVYNKDGSFTAAYLRNVAQEKNMEEINIVEQLRVLHEAQLAQAKIDKQKRLPPIRRRKPS